MSEHDSSGTGRSFGYLNGTFINLYTRENPIKEEGDGCYFLFNPVDSYHVMAIGRGTVTRDWFSEGLNKVYCVTLEEVCETGPFLEKFVWGREYMLVGNADSQRKVARPVTITERSTSAFLAMNLFRVEAFFVRDTLEAAARLRREYTAIMLEDAAKSIEEMREILADNR